MVSSREDWFSEECPLWEILRSVPFMSEIIVQSAVVSLPNKLYSTKVPSLAIIWSLQKTLQWINPKTSLLCTLVQQQTDVQTLQCKRHIRNCPSTFEFPIRRHICLDSWRDLLRTSLQCQAKNQWINKSYVIFIRRCSPSNQTYPKQSIWPDSFPLLQRPFQDQVVHNQRPQRHP